MFLKLTTFLKWGHNQNISIVPNLVKQNSFENVVEVNDHNVLGFSNKNDLKDENPNIIFSVISTMDSNIDVFRVCDQGP